MARIIKAKRVNSLFVSEGIGPVSIDCLINLDANPIAEPYTDEEGFIGTRIFTSVGAYWLDISWENYCDRQRVWMLPEK